MKKKAQLNEVSTTTYLAEILMKLGYTGVCDESEIVIFDPSTVENIVVSVNPLSKNNRKGL